MPYSKYQYVAKVAELQSISKAAAKLFISQPALTRIILNIETELGTTLFNRSVLPIQLTYAGKRYLEEARRISCDPDAPAYDDMAALKRALEE